MLQPGFDAAPDGDSDSSVFTGGDGSASGPLSSESMTISSHVAVGSITRRLSGIPCVHRERADSPYRADGLAGGAKTRAFAAHNIWRETLGEPS
jgi:hypothetical protein